MNFSQALIEARNNLKASGFDSYVIDARILLQKAANISHEELIGLYNDNIEDIIYDKFIELLNFRLLNIPISQILGYKEFFGRDFKVTKDTLTPRPESELIIESAIKLYKKDDNIKILDLGVGTGCLILTLLKEFKNATGVAVDISENAIKIAKYNAEVFSLYNRIEFFISNWFTNIPKQKFDLIISNPPYIENADISILSKDITLYEPHVALFGGDDGLEHYKMIMPNIKKFLKPNGYFIFEFGINQYYNISKLLLKNDLKIHRVESDLANIKRCLITVI